MLVVRFKDDTYRSSVNDYRDIMVNLSPKKAIVSGYDIVLNTEAAIKSLSDRRFLLDRIKYDNPYLNAESSFKCPHSTSVYIAKGYDIAQLISIKDGHIILLDNHIMKEGMKVAKSAVGRPNSELIRDVNDLIIYMDKYRNQNLILQSYIEEKKYEFRLHVVIIPVQDQPIHYMSDGRPMPYGVFYIQRKAESKDRHLSPKGLRKLHLYPFDQVFDLYAYDLMMRHLTEITIGWISRITSAKIFYIDLFITNYSDLVIYEIGLLDKMDSNLKQVYIDTLTKISKEL